MTNTNKLKARIVEKGYTMELFSKAISLSRPSLRKKINGVSEFNVSEINRICAVLDINKDSVASYFFADYVPKMETTENR